MKVITLTVPNDYILPDILSEACPYKISVGLSCCAFVVECMCTDNAETQNLKSQLDTVRENHRVELTTERKRYREEFEEELSVTKKRLMKEYNDQLENVCAMYKKTQESHHDEILNERKRCIEEFTNSLSRITEYSNNQIDALKTQLEHTRQCQEQNLQSYETEKKMLHQWYVTNTQGKDTAIESFTARFDEMMTVIKSLRSSSVSKGQFGENCVRVMLQEWFPKAEITDVSKNAHSGDILFCMGDVTVMIETKTKSHVSKEDISKFEYDIELKKNDFRAALFLTSASGIPNKGEFAFEFIHNIPVIYVSKFLDSPQLLNMSMTLLLHLSPVFSNLKDNDTDDTDKERLQHELGVTIGHLSTMCMSVRQNTKLLHSINQQIVEQKRRNDEKMEWCMAEINRIVREYKIKKNSTQKQTTEDTTRLFDLLYDERQSTKGKYVYKNLVRTVLEKHRIDNYVTPEHVFRVLPKSKFNEQCIKRDQQITS